MNHRRLLNSFPHFHSLYQTYGDSTAAKQYSRGLLNSCKSLLRKDLFGHYGCVNAIEFSREGSWLVSGGDDRRVLLWNVAEGISSAKCLYQVMKSEHMSNIFCAIFDANTTHIFSSGNDEQVMRHNIETKESVGHYHHDEAVYSLSMPSDSCDILATASEDGTVVLWDIRSPQGGTTLSTSAGSFHGVAFNPVDSRLLAAANSHEGVLLFDARNPNRIAFKYGCSPQTKNAMSVRFNYTGRYIYSLFRKSGPVLFDLHRAEPRCQFDDPGYSNICTMKSACFAGDTDQFVVSGSDNFSVYVWKVPGPESSVTHVSKAFMELEGHRSIVNQVRSNSQSFVLASAGVEKIVKLWSPFKMEGSHGDVTGKEVFEKRKHYTHEEYMRLILQSGQPLTHDYDSQSTDEDPRMIAFFDSLIHRVNDGWSTDDSASESSMDGIFQMLINQSPRNSDQEPSTQESDSENVSTTATIAELRRLFRSNRRMLMREFGIDSSSSEDEEISTSPLPSSRFSGRGTFDTSSGLEIIRSSSQGPFRSLVDISVSTSDDGMFSTASCPNALSRATSGVASSDIHATRSSASSSVISPSFVVGSSTNDTSLAQIEIDTRDDDRIIRQEFERVTELIVDSMGNGKQSQNQAALTTDLLRVRTLETKDENEHGVANGKHAFCDSSNPDHTNSVSSSDVTDRKNGDSNRTSTACTHNELNLEDSKCQFCLTCETIDTRCQDREEESCSVSFNRSLNHRKRKYRDSRHEKQ